MNAPAYVLTTPRLGLRPHAEGDAPFMVELNSDPEVVRYTGDTALPGIPEALGVIASLQGQYAQRRLGRLVVEDRATGEKLGWCGLKWLEEDHAVDLGYRFHRRHWGKGYATEAGRACLAHAFGDLRLDRVIARAAQANTASVHVLEKLGFVVIGTGDECGADTILFEVRSG